MLIWLKEYWFLVLFGIATISAFMMYREKIKTNETDINGLGKKAGGLDKKFTDLELSTLKSIHDVEKSLIRIEGTLETLKVLNKIKSKE